MRPILLVLALACSPVEPTAPVAPAPAKVLPGLAARAWAESAATTRGLHLGGRWGLEERRRVPMRDGGGVVTFRPTVDGAPVLDADLTALFDAADRPLSVSTGDALASLAGASLGEPELDASAAAQIAVADRLGAAGPMTAAEAQGGWWTVSAADPDLWGAPRARRVWRLEGVALRPAWQVELLARPDGELTGWRVLVAADDGAVLASQDLTQDAFSYRAWAQTDLRPADDPLADVSPHPTGAPDTVPVPAWGPAGLVLVDGLNTHADPWLDPTATRTTGNNVDAYISRSGGDALNPRSLRAELTTPGVFDYAYDPALAADADDVQAKAALVHAFYTTNWLHDWYYDSGFTETAGNGQLSNFGRGGAEGDALQVATQYGADHGLADNATMISGSDGTPPVLQLRLASGAREGSLVVDPLGALPWGGADFGPQSYDLEAELARGLTATGATTACAPITTDLTGLVGLVDRGDCPFTEKALNAEAAGAVGLVIVDNVPGAPIGSLGGSDPNVHIPAVWVRWEDGAALDAALAAGPVTAALNRTTGPVLDGALDSVVIAHEWGHLVHQRLTDVNTSQSRGMSEGWADFMALLMVARDGDALRGAWPVFTYTSGTITGDPVYFGSRRVPYSVDRAIDPLTYRHVVDGEPLPVGVPMLGSSSPNAESHNMGEVWASMLFDGYVGMQERRGAATFDQIRRRMTDILVVGLALSPPDATFTEARDALLAAARAIDAGAADELAAAFAGRGLGGCAVSPPSGSNDMVGAVESFDQAPSVALRGIALVDGDLSCDDDGLLDGGEVATLRVTVVNRGVAPLVGATARVEADAGEATFPDGAVLVVPDVAPQTEVELSFAVALDPAAPPLSAVGLTVSLDAPDACSPPASASLGVWANAASVPGASATDDFYQDLGLWTVEGTAEVWARGSAGGTDRFWLGADLDGVSDARLVSPTFTASAVDPLVLSFDGRWSFEDDGTAWDGAVLELSADGGPWVDVTRGGVDAHYQGVLAGNTRNPLAGRRAWTGTNAGWPAYETLQIDLGTALAGRSVRFAFRVGSDQYTGATGLEIARFAMAGVTNTPFPTRAPEVAACGPALLADAGPDAEVVAGQAVALDGGGTVGAAGVPLSYAWTQVDGPAVALSGAQSAQASFVAPVAVAGTTLTFELTAGDGVDASVDEVVVTIVDPPVVADTADTDVVVDTDVVDTDTVPPDTVPPDTIETDVVDTDAPDDADTVPVDTVETDTVPVDTVDTDTDAVDTVPVDSVTDTPDDTPTADDTDVTPPDDAGCGCATGGRASALPGLMALAALLRRRRPRSA